MNVKHAKWLWITIGILAANFVGIALCYAFYFLLWLSGRADQSNSARAAGAIFAFAIWPSLLLVPMAMGIVAAWCWRKLDFRFWHYLVSWLAASLITPLGAYLILKEGSVCLIIGFPILFVCGFAGVMLGWIIFRSKVPALNLSIFPLLFLTTLIEGGMRQDRESVVEDRLRIEADIEKVWQYVVAFPRIEQESDYWLNKLGLPSPSETTCQGPFVGAHRECIFSDGLVFKEKVSEIAPSRLLTFEIVEQPNDPELLGHLTLHRGQFEIVDNNDGTTTLIGRSWYTLHMRPLWYFDSWTRDVTSHVHLRVMKHIKSLAESAR